MDLEKLNTTQVVLLTLLVSFVTSIATGIATVALLEQAPEAVKTPVFNVVERTVERVVPETVEVPVPGEVVTTEKTVIVKEEDAITEAISTITERMVRIYNVNQTERSDDGELVDVKTYQGLGMLIGNSGKIMTLSSGVGDRTYSRYGAVIGSVTNDAQLVTVSNRDRESGVTLFDSIATGYSEIIFADRDTIKLGQTVLGITGETANTVATGIVTQVMPLQVSFEATVVGMPIFNLFGEVIAFVGTNNDLIFADDLVQSVRLTFE